MISSKEEEKNGRVLKIARRHTSIVQIDSNAPPPDVNFISFFCGLTAGVSQAGLFNPFDRALYLSVKNRKNFLHWENFQNPYQGFFQSVGHRALSGGLYYPLEQFFMTLPPVSDTDDCGAFSNFLAGTAAGSANAFLVNPISAIKYKSWGREVNRGMAREAMEMLERGGLRPFFNGLFPTLFRDLVFGGCYTFLRFELQYRFQLSREYQWMANFAAAAMATVVSGPFNLARNEQYATRSRHVADTVSVVLTNFVEETKQQNTFSAKCRHVQNRLRLGWGTARVAAGMTFGHFVYDKLHGMYVKEPEVDR